MCWYRGMTAARQVLCVLALQAALQVIQPVQGSQLQLQQRLRVGQRVGRLRRLRGMVDSELQKLVSDAAADADNGEEAGHELQARRASSSRHEQIGDAKESEEKRLVIERERLQKEKLDSEALLVRNTKIRDETAVMLGKMRELKEEAESYPKLLKDKNVALAQQVASLREQLQQQQRQATTDKAKSLRDMQDQMQAGAARERSDLQRRLSNDKVSLEANAQQMSDLKKQLVKMKSEDSMREQSQQSLRSKADADAVSQESALKSQLQQVTEKLQEEEQRNEALQQQENSAEHNMKVQKAHNEILMRHIDSMSSEVEAARDAESRMKAMQRKESKLLDEEEVLRRRVLVEQQTVVALNSSRDAAQRNAAAATAAEARTLKQADTALAAERSRHTADVTRLNQDLANDQRMLSEDAATLNIAEKAQGSAAAEEKRVESKLADTEAALAQEKRRSVALVEQEVQLKDANRTNQRHLVDLQQHMLDLQRQMQESIAATQVQQRRQDAEELEKVQTRYEGWIAVLNRSHEEAMTALRAGAKRDADAAATKAAEEEDGLVRDRDDVRAALWQLGGELNATKEEEAMLLTSKQALRTQIGDLQARLASQVQKGQKMLQDMETDKASALEGARRLELEAEARRASERRTWQDALGKANESLADEVALNEEYRSKGLQLLNESADLRAELTAAREGMKRSADDQASTMATLQKTLQENSQLKAEKEQLQKDVTVDLHDLDETRRRSTSDQSKILEDRRRLQASLLEANEKITKEASISEEFRSRGLQLLNESDAMRAELAEARKKAASAEEVQASMLASLQGLVREDAALKAQNKGLRQSDADLRQNLTKQDRQLTMLVSESAMVQRSGAALLSQKAMLSAQLEDAERSSARLAVQLEDAMASDRADRRRAEVESQENRKLEAQLELLQGHLNSVSADDEKEKKLNQELTLSLQREDDKAAREHEALEKESNATKTIYSKALQAKAKLKARRHQEQLELAALRTRVKKLEKDEASLVELVRRYQHHNSQKKLRSLARYLRGQSAEPSESTGGSVVGAADRRVLPNLAASSLSPASTAKEASSGSQELLADLANLQQLNQQHEAPST
eukprot:TRINITY_DN13409_c0_g1_i1.p1 TRINITY_DN13409_c0_g1~~TRINITY_DN13409_c0_g1_i1.p1  ORF type:complete len:1098 (+),score=428.91 TRINITY_DN13409_c0_g1_i1:192-3485(+)